MRLLGLACGQEDGSAEVLLKAALTVAAREGTAVEMVRLTDLSLVTAATSDAGDDAAWFCDRLPGGGTRMTLRLAAQVRATRLTARFRPWRRASSYLPGKYP